MIFVETAELGGSFATLENALLKFIDDGAEPPPDSATLLEDGTYILHFVHLFLLLRYYLM